MGGAALSRMPAETVRTRVALVNQEHHVFVGSLRDNLLLAKPDAADEELLAALGSVDATPWVETLPDAIDGLVLMNEVLDAIPPRVVARRGGDWFERGVGLDASGAFAWSERRLEDASLLVLAQARFPPEGDYASELNPAAEALVAAVAKRLAEGALLVVDYGFPRHEYYHPQRDAGTLMAHYRHRSLAGPFLWPGLCDLSVHVDFTAVAEAGVAEGLEVAGYASQAAFLLGCGLLDRLAECGQPGSVPYVRATTAVQTLVSPAEMGELFKAIALARTPGLAWPGFALADARHRL
jgi:SAM-dependent MidA family methyltransferase